MNRSVPSGNFEHRIRLHRLTATGDQINDYEAATSIGTDGWIWAEERAPTGREAYESQSQVSVLDKIWRVSYRDGITEKMRVEHRTGTYNIVGIKEPLGARNILDLQCERVR